MKLFRIFIFALPVVFCVAVSAQQVTFELIPGAFSASDMTPDGKYVVGNAVSGPYRYDTQTGDMLILPGASISASAVAVSDDGSVILGNIDEDGAGGNQSTAGIWRESTNTWVSLGYFKSAAAACGSLSSAYELSADGTIATGLGWVDGCNARAFRWSEETGLQAMDMATPDTPSGDRASVISADGSIMGGFAQGSFSRTPAIWNGNDLTAELLDPPNGDALGEIFGIKDDGSILYGSWEGAANHWVYDDVNDEWDRSQIAQGSLIASWQGIPCDAGDNGTVIGFDILMTNRRAWIQYQGDGDLILLKSWANANGANIPVEQALEVATRISTDGTLVCGHSAFPSVGWLLRITPDVLLGDVNLDGAVNLLDVAPFVELLSNGGFQAEADINQDGVVDLLDVAPFVDLLSG